jgi:P63C domain
MENEKPEVPDESTQEEATGRAKGGYARAVKLTTERRKAIARNAANVRWSGNFPISVGEGSIKIGDRFISCAVLSDGRRIIAQADFMRSLGRSRSPKAGTGVLTTVDELPFFLQAEVLKPFISEELVQSTKPIFYITLSGAKGVGYDAQLLTKTCEVYLRYRDSIFAETGKIPERYKKIFATCDTTVRTLAGVAIIALIDEATGYQYARPKDALARILEAFIAKELQPYVQTFPEDYYRELFRLRGAAYNPASVKRPQYFGHLTNDIIYARLAPKVLEELRKHGERTESGRLRYHHHRRLTEDIGHPKLRELLASVVTIMKLSKDYPEFYERLTRLHPKYNTTMLLPLSVEDEGLALGVGF